MSKRISTFLISVIFLFIVFFGVSEFFNKDITYSKTNQTTNTTPTSVGVPTEVGVAPTPLIPPLDTALFDQKLISLANNPPDPLIYNTVKTVTKN